MIWMLNRKKMLTLRFQINVRVQNVRTEKFAINNKRMCPNQHTGWKIYQKKLTFWLENLAKTHIILAKKSKNNKPTVPNVWEKY